MFSDWEGSGAQRRRMTCPRPHSKAIAEPSLSGAQIRAPAATLAVCPTGPGPEARTSGTGCPSAQSRLHAGRRGQRREGGKGRSLPVSRQQGAGGGAGKEKEEDLEAGVRGRG